MVKFNSEPVRQRYIRIWSLNGQTKTQYKRAQGSSASLTELEEWLSS